MVMYSVLSLTVIRMAPVAVALAGARFGRAAVAFVGWFGPRGLASVVFALLALEDLGQGMAARPVAVITFTVLLSVMCTVRPPSRWPAGTGGGSAHRRGRTPLTPKSSGLPERRLIRRASPIRNAC